MSTTRTGRDAQGPREHDRRCDAEPVKSSGLAPHARASRHTAASPGTAPYAASIHCTVARLTLARFASPAFVSPAPCRSRRSRPANSLRYASQAFVALQVGVSHAPSMSVVPDGSSDAALRRHLRSPRPRSGGDAGYCCRHVALPALLRRQSYSRKPGDPPGPPAPALWSREG